MPHRTGFTRTELVAVIIITIVVLCVLVPVGRSGRRHQSRPLDSTQLRGIHKALILFPASASDRYFVPSEVDRTHQTLAEGSSKDLPRHIVSALIFNGFFAPEFAISPFEVNTSIVACSNYQYESPQAAAGQDKKLAMWDPAFKATPNDTNIGANTQPIGNCSYAFMPFFGARREKWSQTFQSTEAVLGCRGPAYDGGGSNGAVWTLSQTKPDASGKVRCGVGSNSLLMHGGPTTWEGNIVYNDNHVALETRPDPQPLRWTFKGIASGVNVFPDNLFVNENDLDRSIESDTLSGNGMEQSNNLLRCWSDAVVSGGKTTSIVPYWD